MRKGLTVTLMTVAVAMMGLQAMASAPVISEIPSPIVADGSGATTPNVFVFPDAINLANYVTDDYTSSTNILWSYWISASPKYRINNILPLDPGTEDPVSPGAKAINMGMGTTGGTETNPDGNPATLTIRNINLSPLGVAAGGEPGPTGKLNSETQLVTFFASDGTTYSSKTIAFYTYNNFDDQLTPGWTAVPVLNQPFANSSAGYSFQEFTDWRGTWGGTLTGTTTGNGICFNVSASGNNAGQYSSPWGIIPLVKYQVYHVRLKMNGSQTTVGHTPYWDVNISNYKDQPGQTPAWRGLNAYGCDSWFMDNRGGANSVLASANGTSMHVWFAPAAVNTAAWNAANGVFDPAVGAERDAYIFWRVMDLSSMDAAITATEDSGSICMTSMYIERYDINGMQTVSTDYNPVLSKGILNSEADAGGTMGAHAYYSQTTVTFSGGTIVVQPYTDVNAHDSSNNYYNSDLITVYPKDATNGHYDADALVPACYPVVWKDDTLYQVTYDLSAPDANSQTNPCDVFYVGADVPTNELIYESYTCAAKNECGMPKFGAPQTYMAFFYSHKATADTVNANNKRIRPRFSMGNNRNLTFANPSQGGIKIHAVKVNEVKFTSPAQ